MDSARNTPCKSPPTLRGRPLEEITVDPVTEAWPVRFGKASPEFEARRLVDLDTTFIAFRAALYLWRAVQGELLGEGT